MTRYRSLVLVLIVALPVASAAGCGGEQEPAPTRQEFIAQANAICQAAEQDLMAAQAARAPTPEETEEDAEFVDEVLIPFYQRQVDEIRELTPPPGDEERIEAALSATERDLSDPRQDLLHRIPKGWVELARWFRRYGSYPCGN